VPPRLVELLIGPWKGLSIYPRAATLRPPQVLALLLLLTLVGSGLVTARWYLVRRAKLEDARESQLWLMPRVTIEGGVARFEGRPGRLLDAEHFLVWIDPTTNVVQDIRLEVGELRPVVHVGRDLLTVHTPNRAPRQIPWSEVVGDQARLSLDGPEAIDWGEHYLRTMALTGMAVGTGLAVGYQLLLLVVLAWLYRVLFYRGLYVPRFGTLICVGGTASIPPLTLAIAAVLLGLGQGTMLTVHGLGLGLLFLVGATRVRLGDERPDQPQVAPVDPVPAMPASAVGAGAGEPPTDR
jgi:hypothetical protein